MDMMLPLSHVPQLGALLEVATLEQQLTVRFK